MALSASRVGCFLLHPTGGTQSRGHNRPAGETQETHSFLHAQEKEMGLGAGSQSPAQVFLLGVQCRAEARGSMQLLTPSTAQNDSGFFLCL